MGGYLHAHPRLHLTSGSTAPLSSLEGSAKETETKSCSSLKSLEFKTTSVGFCLKEVEVGDAKLVLLSMCHMKTDLIKNPETPSQVFDPNNIELRRVNVGIKFRYSIASSGTAVAACETAPPE